MDCRTFCRNLEDYLEGGLDFPGRFGMERHAQQCYLCGKEIAEAQKLGDLAKGLSRAAAPPGFEESVTARIHARGRQGWFRSFWFYGFEWPSQRTLAVSASALFLAGAAVLSAAWLAPWSSSPREVSEGPVVREELPTEVSARTESAQASALTAESSAAMAEAPPSEPPRRAPLQSADRTPKAPFSADDEAWERFVDAGDGEYVEYAVPGPGNRQFIMRLPKTIRMRHGQPSEEYFVRNVSH